MIVDLNGIKSWTGKMASSTGKATWSIYQAFFNVKKIINYSKKWKNKN